MTAQVERGGAEHEGDDARRADDAEARRLPRRTALPRGVGEDAGQRQPADDRRRGACQEMPAAKNVSAALMPIHTSSWLMSARALWATTSSAPISPKIAPEAPRLEVSRGRTR